MLEYNIIFGVLNMTKKIQTTNRKAYLKELLENNQAIYDILKNDKVKSWNISRRQIERYLENIKKSNYELNKLLNIPSKELNKTTYRIPKSIKKDIKAYCSKNNLKQQNIIIQALYEFLENHK